MIALRGSRSYIATMALRYIAHLLTMIALLVAPVSLLPGGAMAMPMEAKASTAAHHSVDGLQTHCKDLAADQSDTEDDTGRSDSDCRAKCAVSCSVVPLLGNPAIEPLVLPPEIPSSLLATLLTGLVPEAADPPPRTA